MVSVCEPLIVFFAPVKRISSTVRPAISMVEVVVEPNCTTVPPTSPLVGLLPPLQFAELDQSPPDGPIHVCVAAPAGDANSRESAVISPEKSAARRIDITGS